MGRRGHHGRRPFPVDSDRAALMSIVRQRKGEALKARRANALLLLDDGRSAAFAAEVLFLDPDTVRGRRRDFAERGLASVELSAHPAREGHPTAGQEAEARERFRAHPPRDTNEARAWLPEAFGAAHSRPGAIKLMHRLGFERVKPERLPKQADREAQEAFIKSCESLMNGLRPDERAVFADAVHPEHQSRPVHVFLDNARCHHAKSAEPWLERPECRLKLHFLPPYAPHLNPIERLWGVMHEHAAHNRFHLDFPEVRGVGRLLLRRDAAADDGEIQRAGDRQLPGSHP